MSLEARVITHHDIMDMDEYGLIRKEKRAELRPLKTARRVPVGPHATFYFENYVTMWHQVHEMLYTERGGDEQLVDELAAFNPLIPQGAELVATLMFEITDATLRASILRRLTHVENHIFIQIGDEKIMAIPEEDVERTAKDGKTSSVHFVRFPFTANQVSAFKSVDAQIILGFDHENYGHLALLNNQTRTILGQDFK